MFLWVTLSLTSGYHPSCHLSGGEGKSGSREKSADRLHWEPGWLGQIPSLGEVHPELTASLSYQDYQPPLFPTSHPMNHWSHSGGRVVWMRSSLSWLFPVTAGSRIYSMSPTWNQASQGWGVRSQPPSHPVCFPAASTVFWHGRIYFLALLCTH